MNFVFECGLDVGKKYCNLQSTVVNEGGLAELFRNSGKNLDALLLFSFVRENISFQVQHLIAEINVKM